MEGRVAAEESPSRQDPVPVPSPFHAAAAAAAAAGEEKGGENQKQQKQMIRWERFLPRRSLRVLLVEHDDSTRHIVSALLRKCSYHVVAVADGLKAWVVLKEKEFMFDLVLTEVEMPSLSGIDLLSNITGCGLSRNIPVIMMSSHDSVSVVYKCMLKGAVDFLVKPVRRNELRNLWQHVWRKHCSTNSVQGQESINHNTIKSPDMSGNNAASNHISAVAGKEICDVGSDTQSSGSTPEGGIQSIARQGEINHTLNMSSLMVVETQIEQEKYLKLLPDTKSFMHSSREKTCNIVEIVDEVISKEKSEEHDFIAAVDDGKEDGADNIYAPGKLGSNLQSRTSNHVIDFIGVVANEECSYDSLEKDKHRAEYHFEAIRPNCSTNESTDAFLSCDLSLRGPSLNLCSTEDSRERCILKHSAASAFSRYSSNSTGMRLANKKSETFPPTLSVTNAHGDRVESQIADQVASKEEMSRQNPAQRSSSTYEDNSCFATGPSREDELEQPHTSVENNEDGNTMPSSGQLGIMPHSFPVRGMPFQSLCPGYGTFIQPIIYQDASLAQGLPMENEEPSRPDLRHNIVYSHPSSVHCKESSHSCVPERRKDRIDDEFGTRYFALHEKEHANSNCVSTHDHISSCSEHDPRSFRCPDLDQANTNLSSCNIANCSASEATDTAANKGIAIDNGIESRSQNHGIDGFSTDRSRREAALIKFRNKRKERCFEKKVRYHSRQKLAEQRPRVKGQFVRHSAVSSTATAEQDD